MRNDLDPRRRQLSEPGSQSAPDLPRRQSGVPQIAAPEMILHLAELVPIVRERLNISEAFPDDALLASLKAVTAHTNLRERASAAFASNLGQHLGQTSADLQTAMEVLLALLPPPRS